MTYLGIDFGTSNIISAVAQDSASPRLVPLEGDKEALPSALFFVSEDDQEEDVPPILYGRRAIKAYLEDGYEGRFMRSPKKVLGTPTFKQNTGIIGKKSSFQAIIAGFLEHVKERSEAHTGQKMTRVVLGRPVNFTHDTSMNATAQNELEQCARDAGFKEISFQFEPIAAAFAHERYVEGEKLALVADLGGGTSDFTIIRLSKDYIGQSDRAQHVLGNSGIRIGGTDFDERLSMHSFMGLLGKGEWYRPPMRDDKIELPLYLYTRISDWARAFEAYTPDNIRFAQTTYRYVEDEAAKLKIKRLIDVLEHRRAHQILNAVENTKIILTQESEACCPLPFLEGTPQVLVNKAEFESAIARDVEQVAKAMSECLSYAQISAEQIDLVVLTGGSTEIPMVQIMVQSLFPKAAISQGNKLDSVGLGLAIESARRYS